MVDHRELLNNKRTNKVGVCLFADKSTSVSDEQEPPSTGCSEQDATTTSNFPRPHYILGLFSADLVECMVTLKATVGFVACTDVVVVVVRPSAIGQVDLL